MTARFKIAILVFIVSLVLPVVVTKLKAPQFLNPLEKTIAEFREPSHLYITERRSFPLTKINDPFKLAEKIKLHAQTYGGMTDLTMIYEGKEKYALFGQAIVKEGDKLGEFRVIKILNDKVLIRDKKGEQRWLKLENY